MTDPGRPMPSAMNDRYLASASPSAIGRQAKTDFRNYPSQTGRSERGFELQQSGVNLVYSYTGSRPSAVVRGRPLTGSPITSLQSMPQQT
jgi:hypothetical protein